MKFLIKAIQGADHKPIEVNVIATSRGAWVNDIYSTPQPGDISASGDHAIDFVYKNKKHIGVVPNIDIKPIGLDDACIVDADMHEVKVDGKVELLKHWDLASGEPVLLSRWAKSSEWIRGYKKDEHKLLLSKLGTMVEYVGKKETFNGPTHAMKIDGVEYEIPEKYLLKY